MKRTSFLLLLFIALILGACSGAETEEDSHTDVQQVTLNGLDTFRYEPETVEVVAGQPVELTLANEGALEHDFSIVELPLTGEVEAHTEDGEPEEDSHEMTMDEDELDLHISAGPGAQETATFVPAEPGEYEFFCTVAGHREGGMVGTLVVTAP